MNNNQKHSSVPLVKNTEQNNNNIRSDSVPIVNSNSQPNTQCCADPQRIHKYIYNPEWRYIYEVLFHLIKIHHKNDKHSKNHVVYIILNKQQ